MDGIRLRIALWPGSAAAVIAGTAVVSSLALGFFAVHAPAVAVLILALGLAILGLTVPPCYWAAAAVVMAVCSRALAAIGLLPESGIYFDVPLAFAAFALAALTASSRSPTARWAVLGVGGLAGAVVASGTLSGSSLLEWLLSFALLASPFAVIGSILLAPPSPSERKALIITLLALALIQVPISIVQAIQASHPDEVQGTFIGSAAGAHLVGAITSVAAFWLIARARSGLYLVGAAALLLVPFLSDAKQVIAVAPVAFAALAVWYPPGRRAVWMRTIVLLGCVAFVVSIPIALNLSYSRHVVERAVSSESGKARAADAIESELTSNFGGLLFGAGPATTVSHSALLATVAQEDPESPLAQLDLEPSQLLQDLNAMENSSLANPPSTALGVVGDLGLLGALTYYAVIGCLFLAAWRLRTSETAAAAAVLALFVVLGFASTWPEQTGFSLYVALLVGLALSGKRQTQLLRPSQHSMPSSNTSNRSRTLT
jgi:hypothetical protein